MSEIIVCDPYYVNSNIIVIEGVAELVEA